MNDLISKTTFKNFLGCPKNAWFMRNRDDLGDLFIPTKFAKHLFEQGNEVEMVAQKLFPNATAITSTDMDAVRDTKDAIARKDLVIFQATFAVNGMYAKIDVLEYDPNTDSWNMSEIKGSSFIKNSGSYDKADHITDAAFQALVLQLAGIKTNKFFLIHLNKKYVRKGNINPYELFCIEDETQKILDRSNDIKNLVDESKEYLNSDEEPKGNCDCIHKSRINHCETFKISNPSVPKYSVHDIARINKQKLEVFSDKGIYTITDIPEDLALSERQKSQIRVHRQNKSEINIDSIRKTLDTLVFPLYFFDYEAISLAIPIFDGYGPYSHIPFQFSLQILESPTGELKERGYLHEKLTEPSSSIYDALKSNINGRGSIIVWNKSYEAGINMKLANRIPESLDFFSDLNTRLYDLRDIFENQLYLHPKARGRSSLKKVLPAIAPELSYKSLNVQDGAEAMSEWWEMITKDDMDEKELMADNLREYCSMDTYAMYAIWKHLEKISQ